MNKGYRYNSHMNNMLGSGRRRSQGRDPNGNIAVYVHPPHPLAGSDQRFIDHQRHCRARVRDHEYSLLHSPFFFRQIKLVNSMARLH